MPRELTAVIPAAGAGRRLGEPKATALLCGVPLLQRQVIMLRNAGVSRIISVVAAAQPDSIALARTLPCEVVLNDRTELGQSWSVRLAAAQARASALLLLPVDFAWTRGADVRALIAAWHEGADPDNAILRPHCGAELGHPVLFGSLHQRAFSQLAEQEPASQIYRNHRDRVQLVPVDNANIRRNVNTREDLRECERFWAVGC